MSKRLSIFVALLMIGVTAQAQHSELSLSLSNPHVNDVLKQKNGLLWVATQEGLNLFYDDQKSVFFAEIEDTLSVLDSEILQLKQGFAQELVTLSKGGLSVFDAKRFSFRQIPLGSTPTNYVKDPVAKTIWVTTQQSGLYIFDEYFTLLHHFEFDPLNPLSISTSRFDEGNGVEIYFEPKGDKAYIATQNGLNVYDKKLATFKRFFKGEKTQLTTNQILSVFALNETAIGILSQNELITFNSESNQFEKNQSFESPLVTVARITDQIYLVNTADRSQIATIQDNRRLIFDPIIGNNNYGIFNRVTPLDDQFVFWKKGDVDYLIADSNLASFSRVAAQDNINAVFTLDPDSFLLGTNQGLSQYSEKSQLVQTRNDFSGALFFSVQDGRYISVYPNSIEGGTIAEQTKTPLFKKSYSDGFNDAMFEPLADGLVIAGKTLSFFDFKTQKLIPAVLSNEALKNVAIDNIKALDDQLYLSYPNGIIQLPIAELSKPKADEKQLVFYEYNALLNRNIARGFYDIEKVNDLLFVTDNQRGLVVYKDHFGNFQKSFTYNGNPLETLASSTPTKLYYEQDTNQLYIGTTGSGLFSYDLAQEQFNRFTLEQGLLSNNILDIKKIGTRLFIQTVSGINYFENDVLKNINVEDGLSLSNFHPSALHTSDNQVYVSGYDILQYFSINGLDKESVPFSISFFKGVGIDKQNNEKIIALETDNTLEIDYQIQTLTLDFFVDTFYKTQQINYYFKRGEEADISNGYNNVLQISGLPYYSTQLEVYAIDGANQRSKNTLLLTIYNSPPWWIRVEMLVLYVLLSIVLVYTLVKYREGQTKKRMESERKSKELEEARELQNSLLPKTNPSINGMQISTYLKSATEIGGDYYDFFYKENEYFYAICGDATGHGVISGIMVSVTKAGLNGIPMDSPSRILQQLNRIVKRVNFGRLRMSLSVAKLNSDSVELSSAAMPPTYFYSAKSKRVEEILVPNLPLGGIETEQYDGIKKQFDQGDILVMISDGLPELPNPKNELLDYDKVYNCVKDNAQKDAEGIKNALVALSDDWAQGLMNPDDITIVVIKKAA